MEPRVRISGQPHSNNKDADSVAINIIDAPCRPKTSHINEIHQRIAEARSTIVNSPRDDAKDGPHNAALAAAKKLLEENKEELNTHA